MPIEDIPEFLRNVGMRASKPRVQLSELLFGGEGRHVTAESLYEEAIHTKIKVTLTTVYNTLNQFSELGLLREIAVDGNRTYYDTNTSNHHHFYNENSGQLYDIDSDDLKVIGLPTPPNDQNIWRIDVIVRLKKMQE
ncbi:MAG: transcriptional repressor [Hyphomicrobiales bacterium]|nr:MAG: transcriptional repressor [Hyphomicrobiales bacterium]